jgi:homogentisate 1,2-dioxygenase
MQPVHSKGRVARQAHVGLPEGTYEEEHGRETFFGRASHLYRRHPPTAWTRIEGPLRPRALDLNHLKTADLTDPGAPWALVAGNDDVRLYISRRSEPAAWFLRDGDGDVCYFVHAGEGTIETDYGPLAYRPGDYVIVPKGTTHRVVPTGGEESFLLVIEGTGEYRLPDRGLLGKHAQFDPGVLAVPEPEPHDEQGPFEVRIKRDGTFTTLTFAWHPLDVVGWQGDLCPVRLNILDHRPVISPRYHLPPSAHTTFVNDGFGICSFVPRPLEEDPDVLRVPFFHANIDADEVLFYHSGTFFSRAGIGAGFMTLHPQGIHHGPQPAAIAASATKTRTDEVAVMIEARRPLHLTPEAESVAVEEYETSWARGMGLLDKPESETEPE